MCAPSDMIGGGGGGGGGRLAPAPARLDRLCVASASGIDPVAAAAAAARAASSSISGGAVTGAARGSGVQAARIKRSQSEGGWLREGAGSMALDDGGEDDDSADEDGDFDEIEARVSAIEASGTQLARRLTTTGVRGCGPRPACTTLSHPVTHTLTHTRSHKHTLYLGWGHTHYTLFLSAFLCQ